LIKFLQRHSNFRGAGHTYMWTTCPGSLPCWLQVQRPNRCTAEPYGWPQRVKSATADHRRRSRGQLPLPTCRQGTRGQMVSNAPHFADL